MNPAKEATATTYVAGLLNRHEVRHIRYVLQAVTPNTNDRRPVNNGSKPGNKKALRGKRGKFECDSDRRELAHDQSREGRRESVSRRRRLQLSKNLRREFCEQ